MTSPMLVPSHPDYGKTPDPTVVPGGSAPQVTLPAIPEVRRWIERTRQDREALQARATRLREQFEPLRKQLQGIERSIKVLDHFLAQVSIGDGEGDTSAPSLRAVRARPGGRLLSGQWSRKHAACLGCGGTERSHKAQGYCSPCYEQHGHRAAPAGAVGLVVEQTEIRP